MNQGVQFITFAVIARILTPEDVGVMALAVMIIGIGRLVLDLGLGMAIIRDKNTDETQLNTVFWISLFVAAVLYFAITFSAGPISGFLNNSTIGNIIHLSNLVLFFESCRLVPNSILRKNLEFKNLAIISTVNSVTYSAISLTLAFSNYGLYSLLYAYIFSSLLSAVMSYRLSGWYPKFKISLKKSRSLLKFGINLSFSSIISYINENIERLLLAKYIGVFELGVYHFVKRIISLPQQLLSQNIGVATYPILAKIKDDDAELSRTYLFLLRSMSLIAFPTLSFLAFTSEAWIPVIFGGKWESANVPIKILFLSGIFGAVVSPLGNVYLAKGKSVYSLIINLSVFVLVIALYPFAAKASLNILCAAVVFVSFAGFLLNIYFSSKEIKAGFTDNLKSVLPSVIYSSVLIYSVIIINRYTLNSGKILALTLDTIFFLLTFSAISFFLYKKNMIKLYDIFSSKFLNKKPIEQQQ